MPRTAVLVTQTGADADSFVQFDLPQLDGKSGYEILAVHCRWDDIAAVAAADYTVFANVQTHGTVEQVPSDNEWIAGVAWGAQNTAGTAVLIPVEPLKSHILAEPRVTVQDVYACVASAGTSQANDVYFVLEYGIVKLSEVEYLRLLAGGA